jgi:uncharacterized damage-inducible protein DinB
MAIAIAPFYQGWENYQRLLVNAVAPLSPEQLDLTVAEHQWTVSVLVRHIVTARIGWFHNWMGEGGEEVNKYTIPVLWEDDPEAHPTASELVQGLEDTWQMIDAALHHWTSDDMDQTFHNPWNPARPDRSRQWIIWHVLEHDMHHGGEISLTLGTHHLAAIDL